MLIVHGNQRETKAELEREAKPYPNIKLFGVSGIQAILPLSFLCLNSYHMKMYNVVLWSTLPGNIRCSGRISADIFNLIEGNTKENPSPPEWVQYRL